jgi:hypothetical protein
MLEWSLKRTVTTYAFPDTREFSQCLIATLEIHQPRAATCQSPLDIDERDHCACFRKSMARAKIRFPLSFALEHVKFLILLAELFDSLERCISTLFMPSLTWSIRPDTSSIPDLIASDNALPGLSITTYTLKTITHRLSLLYARLINVFVLSIRCNTDTSSCFSIGQINLLPSFFKPD